MQEAPTESEEPPPRPEKVSDSIPKPKKEKIPRSAEGPNGTEVETTAEGEAVLASATCSTVQMSRWQIFLSVITFGMYYWYYQCRKVSDFCNILCLSRQG